MIPFFNMPSLRSHLNIRPFIRFFCSKVEQKKLPKIAFDRLDQLIKKEQEVQAQLRKHGYLILSAPTTDRQLLFDVARLFGRIQGHVRSPKDGIVEIRSQFSTTQDNQVDSSIHFFAHTDGHYLDGIASQKGQTFRVVPPKIIALQCVKPATNGGVSFLIDGQAILRTITNEHPLLLQTLFKRNCTSICRENHLVTDVPVFAELPSGNFSVRFSYDKNLYVPEWAKKDVNFFNEHYILNREFATYFSLAEREILILDNHRHLHGRTAIDGERVFRRVWIQDESLSEEMHVLQKEGFLYYGSDENATQAFDHYQPYAALCDSEGVRFGQVLTGINIPKRLRSKIGKAISMPIKK